MSKIWNSIEGDRDYKALATKAKKNRNILINKLLGLQSLQYQKFLLSKNFKTNRWQFYGYVDCTGNVLYRIESYTCQTDPRYDLGIIAALDQTPVFNKNFQDITPIKIFLDIISNIINSDYKISFKDYYLLLCSLAPKGIRSDDPNYSSTCVSVCLLLTCTNNDKNLATCLNLIAILLDKTKQTQLVYNILNTKLGLLENSIYRPFYGQNLIDIIGQNIHLFNSSCAEIRNILNRLEALNYPKHYIDIIRLKINIIEPQLYSLPAPIPPPQQIIQSVPMPLPCRHHPQMEPQYHRIEETYVGAYEMLEPGDEGLDVPPPPQSWRPSYCT